MGQSSGLQSRTAVSSKPRPPPSLRLEHCLFTALSLSVIPDKYSRVRDKTLVLITQPQCNGHCKPIPDWPMDTTRLQHQQKVERTSQSMYSVYRGLLRVLSLQLHDIYRLQLNSCIYYITWPLVWWNGAPSHHCKVVKAVDGEEHSIYSQCPTVQWYGS